MIASIKRLFFLFGILLAGAAFLAAAAEIAAHASNPDLGALPSAAEVWRAISPDTFEGIENRPGAVIWSNLLSLPGWLILGVPGLALIIAFRTRDDGPILEHEHSLFLFDELAKQAREEGFDDDNFDTQPSDPSDFVPAEAHYANDDVAEDLIHDAGDADADERDFLLNDENAPEAANGKTQNDKA